MSPSVELAAGVCKDAPPFDTLCPKSANHTMTGQYCTDVVRLGMFYSAAFWPCKNSLRVADSGVACSHGIVSWPVQEMISSTCKLTQRWYSICSTEKQSLRNLTALWQSTLSSILLWMSLSLFSSLRLVPMNLAQSWVGVPFRLHLENQRGMASTEQLNSCNEWAHHQRSWTLLSRGLACKMAPWRLRLPKA